ncbi:MAG TPA: energy-coupling factor transporter transmembrane component T [Thermomicrobiales bacterium]|nr:energy-coupling factor transporter transmembrane component T [Thermomicrobiales bacterium]
MTSRRDAAVAGDAVNAAAWMAWFAAVAVVPLTTRNPLYLALALTSVLAVYLSLPRLDGAARAWRLFVVVGSSLALLSVGFNLLTVHAGDRPFAWLPDRLPVVGGPLTFNALAYGLLSAAAISTLLIAAAAFNTAVRQGDLIRLLPGGFASLGVAGSIAVTTIPQTIASARDIYDAQRARGKQFRGVRDARGILVPLLGTSMERALTLSEALETRGFGASAMAAQTHPRRRLHVIAIPAGLLVVALLLLGGGRVALGLGALAAAVAAALALAPRRGRRIRYRPLVWSRPSMVVAATAFVSALNLLLAQPARGATLAYDTFPRLDAPPFDPFIGLGLLLLLAPAWWGRR